MATKHDLPSFEEYFVPTVKSLRARGGSSTIEELEDDVADYLSLSDEVLEVPHGDGPRTQFQYELAWVRTYLKMVGALENSERGVWRITALGAAMTEDELRGVRRRVVAERRKRKKAEPAQSASDEGDPEPAEISWKERLLDILLAIKPDAFERLCQRVLRESGLPKLRLPAVPAMEESTV